MRGVRLGPLGGEPAILHDAGLHQRDRSGWERPRKGVNAKVAGKGERHTAPGWTG
jgi:hypothetical protein